MAEEILDIIFFLLRKVDADFFLRLFPISPLWQTQSWFPGAGGIIPLSFIYVRHMLQDLNDRIPRRFFREIDLLLLGHVIF